MGSIGGIRLGKIAGIEIEIDYSWFLILALLAYSLAVGLFQPALPELGIGFVWLLALATAILLFVSVLVHELAHSLVAKAHGIEVPGITLFLFGGVSRLRDEPKTPGVEFQVAVVGPITSFAIGAVAFGVWLLARVAGWAPALQLIFQYLAVINVVLAVFNLLPGFPLDGGRILRSAIWHFTGNLRRATRYASYGGQAIAWLLIIWGFWRVLNGDFGGLWLAFIGWFLNNAAQQAYQQLLLRRMLQGVPVTAVMTPPVPAVPPNLSLDRFVDDYLLRGEYTLYPVVEEERLVGVVGLEDVREVPREAWAMTPVRQIAHPPASERVVPPTEDAWDALMQMMETNSRRLLVVRDSQLEGVVGQESLARLVQRKLQLDMR